MTKLYPAVINVDNNVVINVKYKEKKVVKKNVENQENSVLMYVNFHVILTKIVLRHLARLSQELNVPVKIERHFSNVVQQ